MRKRYAFTDVERVANESKLLLSSSDLSLFRLFERSKAEGMNTSSGARILSIGKESLLDIAEVVLGSLDGLFVALILLFRRD